MTVLVNDCSLLFVKLCPVHSELFSSKSSSLFLGYQHLINKE